MTSDDRTPAERAAFLKDRIIMLFLLKDNLPPAAELEELTSDCRLAFEAAERRGRALGGMDDEHYSLPYAGGWPTGQVIIRELRGRHCVRSEYYRCDEREEAGKIVKYWQPIAKPESC